MSPTKTNAPCPVRIRLGVAHRSPVMQAGLHVLLGRVADFDIVGAACNGGELLAMIDRHMPDVILADIDLPGFSPEHLAITGNRTSVLLLAAPTHPAWSGSASRPGAAGWIALDAGANHIEAAIRSVLNEGSKRGAAEITSPASPLTPRQIEVLRLIAEGRGTRDIALHLGLSIKTVETHRAQIASRLGISEVAGLVRYAIRQGISPL